MKKNKKAVSLIIVMWIVLVTWLLAITIIELIIPFSRSVSGMENSSKAYYLANAWVEDWLLKLKKEYEIIDRNPSWSKVFDITTYWSDRNVSKDKIFSELKMKIFWNIEPENWKWDSDYDNNKIYNIISVWNPIQMDITWINPNNFQIYFKVPTINRLTYKLEDNNKIYINWQVTSENWFLNSVSKVERLVESWTWPFWSKVLIWNNINNFSIPHNLNLFHWIDNNDEPKKFQTFFNSNCTWWKKCILKFSIANELIWIHPTDSTKKTILPYLEWRTSYTWWNFKLRYSTIESTWKSNNFVKKLEVKVPQATVNEAFDFTVFQ